MCSLPTSLLHLQTVSMATNPLKVAVPRTVINAVTPKSGMKEKEEDMYVLVESGTPQGNGKLVSSIGHPSGINTIGANKDKSTREAEDWEIISLSGGNVEQSSKR